MNKNVLAQGMLYICGAIVCASILWISMTIYWRTQIL